MGNARTDAGAPGAHLRPGKSVCDEQQCGRARPGPETTDHPACWAVGKSGLLVYLLRRRVERLAAKQAPAPAANDPKRP